MVFYFSQTYSQKASVLIASPPNTLWTALLGLLNIKCLNPHSRSSTVHNSALPILVKDTLACSLIAEALCRPVGNFVYLGGKDARSGLCSGYSCLLACFN